MDMARERISLTVDMLLSLHIGFSHVRTAVGFAILERISGFEPSSEIIAPRHLKLVIVPSFCSLNTMSVWMQLTLFVIRLVFSALFSILYIVQVLLRLSTSASSSCSSSVGASMLSANSRLVMVLPPVLTFP